jgi:hypothetical protein
MIKFLDYIYDIIQNSIHAKSSLITLKVSFKDDMLYIHINDDGQGMSDEVLRKVRNFDFTSNEKRSVGLGLTMIHDLTKQTSGDFQIESIEHKGTNLYLSFNHKHIDFPEFGNLAELLSDLYIHQALQGFKLIYCKNRSKIQFELSKYLLEDLRSFKIKKFIEEEVKKA